jgi:hypothetical protein
MFYVYLQMTLNDNDWKLVLGETNLCTGGHSPCEKQGLRDSQDERRQPVQPKFLHCDCKVLVHSSRKPPTNRQVCCVECCRRHLNSSSLLVKHKLLPCLSQFGVWSYAGLFSALAAKVLMLSCEDQLMIASCDLCNIWSIQSEKLLKWRPALLMIVHNHSQNMTFASYEIWQETYLKTCPTLQF